MPTKTIQIRQRGTLTIPQEIREKYGMAEGDPPTVVDLDGAVLLTPEVLLVPRLAEEIERNLAQKLPGALPLFARFIDAPWVETQEPSVAEVKAAVRFAHPKDAPILAAALFSGASTLVTHNTRHYRRAEGVRVVKPGTLLREIRAWMIRFGR